jgi:hypothetical protein
MERCNGDSGMADEEDEDCMSDLRVGNPPAMFPGEETQTALRNDTRQVGEKFHQQ